MASAADEVAGLDKVLTRLALTEEDKLERVLSKLIPAVIGSLSSPHDSTRKKVLEVLSHVNKRVKGVTTLHLPLAQLLALFSEPTQAPLVRNFALVYTETAFERADPVDRLTVIGPLVAGLSSRPAQHQAICLRVAVSALEHFPPPQGSIIPTETSPLMLQKFPFLGSKEDRTAFLGYCLKWLLYSPAKATASNRAPSNPLQAAQQAAAAAAAVVAATAAAAAGGAAAAVAAHTEVAAAYPCLSLEDVKVCEHKGVPAADALGKRKLGMLHFLAGAGLPPHETLVHFLAAAADSNDAVSRRGEELLKKCCALDSMKPAVNLEDAGLVASLFSLFHGNSSETTLDSSVPVEKRRAPAGPGLRSRLVGLMCRSIAAANQFPAVVQTISECVFGAVTTPRLKQQGVEFAVWVFKHAGEAELKAMAPVVLEGLIRTIEDSAGGGDQASMTLRGFAYTAVGCLAQRVPTLFHSRIDIARSFFAALSDEPPGLRATLQEAVGSLAVAYKDLPATARSDVDGLLLASITSGKDAVRLCATQWANKLFPFDHAPARYICVVAAGDAKLEVREEGLKGLHLSPAQQQLLQQQAEGGSSTASTAAAALAALVWPSLGQMVGHLQMRVPRLFAVWDINRSLALPQKSYMALIQFLQLCKKKSTTTTAPLHSMPLADTVMAEAAPSDTSETGGGMPDGAGHSGVVDVYDRYSALLECGLVREAGGELLEVALEALLELATDPPGRWDVAAERFAQHLPWLRSYTSHVSSAVRTSGAKLVGVAAAALTPADAMALLVSLSSTAATVPMPASTAVAATITSVLPSSTSVTPAVTAAEPSSPSKGAAGTAAASAVATGLTGSAATASVPSKGSSSAKQEEQEGALLTLGYVLAQLRLTNIPSNAILGFSESSAGVVPADGDAPSELFAAQRSAVAALAEAMHSSNLVLASTAAAALGLVSLRGPLQPLLLSTPTPAVEAAAAADAVASPPSSTHSGAVHMVMDDKVVANVKAVASSESASAVTSPAAAVTSSVAPAAASAVPAVGVAAVAVVAEPRGSLGGVVSRVVELMGDKDVKVAGRAVIAAGHMARGMPCTEVLTPLLAALYKLCFNKAEDIQFAVGEALSYAFGAVPVTSDCILRTSFLSLADEFAILRGGDQAPVVVNTGEAMDIAGEGSPSTELANADLAAAQSQILDKILKDLIHHSRSEVRCAAVVWLVSLLTYCCTGGGEATARKGAGSSSAVPAAVESADTVAAAVATAGRVPAKIKELLPAIQGALSSLLGDSNELAQEMASRGVSLVYSLGDEATRKTLMAALVGVLQGAPQAKTAVKLSGDTQVFEEGAIGSVPGGGGMSTYKELCALATDLGQPDLIYKFMDLAHHQQALNSRRGAAFGFAGIARLAAAGGEGGLTQHIGALLPKLYRYQYDPNPRVQDAMGAIWRSLVDDPKAAVEAHFGPIITELLKEMGGRQWRNRQAACGALADLVQGRRWPELCPHFGEVWSMMLRAMDDIKESVRQAAIGLARSVRGLTLRMVDPQAATPADAAATFSVLLPLLLEQGLASNVSEVRIVTLDTLAKASKVAGPAVLRPHLAPLVVTMLEALSNLEDARLNYVEQHAERMGFDNDKLEGARVNASRSGPVGDTLDLAVRYADEASLTSLIPALTGLLKRGVGLNTKVGTARFIRSLVVHSASAISPHAPALLKALTSGAFAERSNTVRKAYAGAAAQVARHATAARVDKFVASALSAYSEGSDDVDRRLVGGLLLKELLKGSPETAAGCAAAILPTAFGAKMDEDEGVAAVWKTVWEEGVSSEAGAIRLYAVEIVELLLQGLASQSWGRKKACAEAVGGLAEVGGDAIIPFAPSLASALITESSGRLWEGKEKVLVALAALCKHCPKALDPSPGHSKLLEVFLSAAGKKKVTYQLAALTGMEAVLSAFQGDHYDQVSAQLLDACAKHVTTNADKASTSSSSPATATTPSSTSASPPHPSTAGDATDTAEVSKPWPLVETLKCLSAAISHAGEALTIPSTTSGSVSGQAASSTSASGSSTSSSAKFDTQLAVLIPALTSIISASLPWQARLAAINVLRAVTQRVALVHATGSSVAALSAPAAASVAACVLDIKIQALREAGLAALLEMVLQAEGGGLWGSECVSALLAQMQELEDGEKAAGIVAAAGRVREALSSGSGLTAQPTSMES